MGLRPAGRISGAAAYRDSARRVRLHSVNQPNRASDGIHKFKNSGHRGSAELSILTGTRHLAFKQHTPRSEPEMNDLPSDPRKIRARIRRYERTLYKEKELSGFYRDGYGKRYLLGPLYMLMGDQEGALRSFDWFDSEFSDDCGEPGHSLCWTLILHRAGDEQGATRKLLHTVLLNLHIVPRLLGQSIEELDIWHGSSDEHSWHLQYIPEEYFSIWNDEERAWISDLHRSPVIQEPRARHIDIHRELRNLPPGPRRSQLVREASALGK